MAPDNITAKQGVVLQGKKEKHIFPFIKYSTQIMNAIGFTGAWNINSQKNTLMKRGERGADSSRNGAIDSVHCTLWFGN